MYKCLKVEFEIMFISRLKSSKFMILDSIVSDDHYYFVYIYIQQIETYIYVYLAFKSLNYNIRIMV